MTPSGGLPTEGPLWGTGQIEVRLLGPFEVVLGGRPVHIGSPKQRAVLAMLALNARRVVTSDALCDLVWDEDQPASASATLQSLISRLRRALAGAPGGDNALVGDVVRTREPGWVLDVDPAAVDALRFEELTRRARSRRARGEVTAAARDLAGAVGLWRGAALLDVVDAGYLVGQATRLNEAHLDAVEDLAEAELAAGRPADALDRLERQVESNPLRERAWGLLMLALYRLGRQAAALRAFQQVRARLADELGIEPSPELAGIEQRILRHDPTLAGPNPPGGIPPAPWSAPAPSAAPAAAEPSRELAGEFAEYSVVVVEDHDFQRRTVVQLLRNLGVGTVRDAAGGADALRLLESGPSPDIIVCDIDMPGMDGVEFVTRVAERNMACAVVIASGLEANVLQAVESIGRSQGVHVLAALEKPLTARRLGDVLRRYNRLDRQQTGHPESPAIGSEQVREALEVGELATWFEPRIDLVSGAVSSAQVRARWDAPDGRSLPSGLFMPVLAREGLLLRFIQGAVSAASELLGAAGVAGLDATTPFRVAVNLSLLALDDASLADHLAALVRAEGNDPRRFVCEIDDVVLARAPAAALSVLTRLRVKGFGLSMSHCGAGSMWTQQLGRAPLSELKLDPRLVSDATGDPKRLALLESALSSARETGLAVVADGCESRADFDTLLALGCSEVQGRFIAAPMPAGDVVAWAHAGYRPDDSSPRS